MVGADEQSYEEVINKLKAFKSKASGLVTEMRTAGKDCVDNTDNDPAAVKSNDSLNTALSQITTSLEGIDQIVAALEQELQDIIEAANKANALE
ncbi:MAG: hypothetical protein K5682_08005 [Lachnospiraceae bacterium]|nr:hypothetical protein [Lachnospiraceae bacterium]